MAKKNLSAGGKTISSTSSTSSGTNIDHRNRKSTQNIQLSEEEKKEKFEKYKPTGDFEKDFIELCALLGIPSLCVVARPKRPVTPSSSPLETSMSKGKDKNHHNQQIQTIQETNNSGDKITGDSLPTTFIVATNKYDYFKPRIEIETEEEANRVFVKELYIRGWRVDQRIIDVLSITMPELERLTVIDFWNVGLTDDTVLTLGHCLMNAFSLKTLRLDGNSHTTAQRFDVFLNDRSLVQNLSLKSCNITDLGAMHLGNCLAENKTLLTLNLCFNKLTDEGVKHLAKGLRMNRTLLSLNLGNNDIEDEGAKAMAEVLSTFPLTHEETVARRQLLSTFINEDCPNNTSQMSMHERPPTATRSMSKDIDKKHKDKNTNKKKDQNNNKLKDVGVKKGPSNTDATKDKKNAKNKVNTKSERIKILPSETENTCELKNPLLENVRVEDGKIWITGNRSLINLNLARNNINESGLSSLLEAMKQQGDSSNENNRVSGTGLMRLSLQKNTFPHDHQLYTELNEIMKSRDPFYKPPTPIINEDSVKNEN